MTQKNKYLGTIGAIWGFAGAFALIGYAVWRLTPLALNALDYPTDSHSMGAINS